MRCGPVNRDDERKRSADKGKLVKADKEEEDMVPST